MNEFEERVFAALQTCDGHITIGSFALAMKEIYKQMGVAAPCFVVDPRTTNVVQQKRKE